MTADDEHTAVQQAPNRVDRRAIVTVTLVSFAITAIALVVAWALLQAWGQAPRPATPAAAPRTIATLEQSLILHNPRAVDLQRQQEASLQRWEWIDRDAGIAHIPIDTAMDLVAQPAGSAPAATETRP